MLNDYFVTRASIILEKQSDLIFNSITLLEPKKDILKSYVESRDTDVPRIADVIASGKGNKTYDVWEQCFKDILERSSKYNSIHHEQSTNQTRYW